MSESAVIPAEVPGAGLNARQRAFVEHLASGMTQTAAYKAAGYASKSEEAACNAASRLLGNGRVTAFLVYLQKIELARYEITEEKTLREDAYAAYFDPDALFDEDGKPKRLIDVAEPARRALEAVEVDVTTGRIVKYKVRKDTALTRLYRYQQLFREASGGLLIPPPAEGQVQQVTVTQMSAADAYRRMLAGG